MNRTQRLLLKIMMGVSEKEVQEVVDICKNKGLFEITKEGIK